MQSIHMFFTVDCSFELNCVVNRMLQEMGNYLVSLAKIKPSL